MASKLAQKTEQDTVQQSGGSQATAASGDALQDPLGSFEMQDPLSDLQMLEGDTSGAVQMEEAPDSLIAQDAEATGEEEVSAKRKSAKPDSSEIAKPKKKLKQLDRAVEVALGMTKKALGNVKTGNKKYKKWMDKGQDATRMSHVKSGYTKIKESLEKDKIIFKKWDLPNDHKFKYNSTYAYVRSGEKENNMYLGGVFWVAKMKGLDSKGGTIVHELSHRLHATSDHHYGTGESKESAKNDPAKATTNADNYEHLAESS